jgi:hypothetical protein
MLAGSAMAVAAFASGAAGTLLAHTPARAHPAAVAAGTAASRGGAQPAWAASGSRIVLTHILGGHRHAHSVARRIMRRPRFGWTGRHQFRDLDKLWNLESGWNRFAYNPYSGAYGIPQALPGSKMASAGPCWRRCVGTQIRWGLEYIKSRYRSPIRAWRHERADGWY